MTYRLLCCALFLILQMLPAQCTGAETWKIVENGKPMAAIAVPDDAGSPVRIAADDLQSYIKQITGANLPVVSHKDIDKQETGKTVILIKGAPNNGQPLGSFLIKTASLEGRPAVLLQGSGDQGQMYAAYTLLEKLGVRFFHPEQEYVPKRTSLSVNSLDIKEAPVYKQRGIQQHTLHPIPHTDIFMDNPTEANLQRAYRYVDWLAKNRQNYLFWWWVGRADPQKLKSYVNKITDYAHNHGVKVGLVVGMPFDQQDSYNIIKGEACHSDREKWTTFLHQGVDEMAALGIDGLCVFFGNTEGSSFKQPEGCSPVSPVQATVERIEALNDYVKEKYPHIEITLWVHPTAGIKGDDTCPNYFLLPGLCSKDIGAAVHTVQFYNLLDPAPTYMNKDFKELQRFALEQAKVRPVWYWPETAYWCGFDCDLPMYFPGYIYSRWVDADLLAGKAYAHITFSTGLEWMYWLNDYAVARFGWDPRKYDSSEVIEDFASIFTGDARPAVKEALFDLMMANDHYLLKRSDQEGFNLMKLLAIFHQSNELGALGGKSIDQLRDYQRTQLSALEGMADRYTRARVKLEAVSTDIGKTERPWFDELLDSIRITELRLRHQLEVFRAASSCLIDQEQGKQVTEVDTSPITAIQRQAKQLITQREKAYRYPADVSKSNRTSYLASFMHWENFANQLNQFVSPEKFYGNIERYVRARTFRLNVFAPVGRVHKTVVTLPEDFPVDRELSLLFQAEDVDSDKEGTAIVGGKEYPLKYTGDSTLKKVRLDLPAGTFKHGENEIAFRFNDTLGGTTQGYYISAICVAAMKN